MSIQTLSMRAQPFLSLILASQTIPLQFPAYTPLRHSAWPTMRTVMTWPDDSVSIQQDCFKQTDWDLFACLDYIVLHRKCACGRKGSGFPKPETLDDQPGPYTPQTHFGATNYIDCDTTAEVSSVS